MLHDWYYSNTKCVGYELDCQDEIHLWYWVRYGVTVLFFRIWFAKEPSHSCQVRVGAMPMQHLRLNEIKCHIIEHTITHCAHFTDMAENFSEHE